MVEEEEYLSFSLIGREHFFSLVGSDGLEMESEGRCSSSSSRKICLIRRF